MTEFITTYSSWIWLGILILCIVIEALTMSLTTIWGAISSIPLIFIAKTPLPFQWQLLIFAILTLVLIIFTRPFAVKKLKTGREKTNVNTMVGQEVIVESAISQFEKGKVKTKNGVIWSAESLENKLIPEGTLCRITAVQGNTLIIKEKGEN